MKIWDVLKELWIQGWDFQIFEFGNEIRIICSSRDELTFTISIMYPPQELKDWLIKSEPKNEGLGALFG